MIPMPSMLPVRGYGDCETPECGSADWAQRAQLFVTRFACERGMRRRKRNWNQPDGSKRCSVSQAKYTAIG